MSLPKLGLGPGCGGWGARASWGGSLLATRSLTRSHRISLLRKHQQQKHQQPAAMEPIHSSAQGVTHAIVEEAGEHLLQVYLPEGIAQQ